MKKLIVASQKKERMVTFQQLEYSLRMAMAIKYRLFEAEVYIENAGSLPSVN